MILLQLSSAQGPDECCLAVSKALEALRKEAVQAHVALSVIEEEPGPRAGTLRSALVSLEAKTRNRSRSAGAGQYSGYAKARIARVMPVKTGLSARRCLRW
ncbi:Peptide chain release factor homolog [Cronobacter malonaticus 507]|nr:Peptide chain release factor homolog [Cronobacter malonaticus 507]